MITVQHTNIVYKNIRYYLCWNYNTIKPHNTGLELMITNTNGKSVTEITACMCQLCNHKNTTDEIGHYIQSHNWSACFLSLISYHLEFHPVREAPSTGTFKQRLKSFYFNSLDS